MKSPTSDLWLWIAALTASAVYLGAGVTSAAPRFQFVVAALAALLIVVAVLLLIRFRWSPELVAALAVFLLLWALIRILGDGLTSSRIGMLFGACCALFGYPSLRHEVRPSA